MEWLNNLIDLTSTALYSYILIILLVFGGLYFFIRIKGAPITMIREQIRCIIVIGAPLILMKK